MITFAGIFVTVLGLTAYVAWMIACSLTMRALQAELRPFALPGLLLSFGVFVLLRGFSPAVLGVLVTEVLCWWVWYRRTTDDGRWTLRWRRLVRALAAR